MQTQALVRDYTLELKQINPATERKPVPKRQHRLQKVLVANRGEIAKRFFHALREESIPSVAVVTDPDIGQSWYALADEAIFIGDAMNYMNIDLILAAVELSGANAVYPGYGFLSENAMFADAIQSLGDNLGQPVIFMGPESAIMKRVGNKLDARQLAKAHGIPLFEGSEALQDTGAAIRAANEIGYPLIVKLNAGGGGKGMQPVFSEAELKPAIESCQRIGAQLYSDDTYYLERLIQKPVHMEVQIFNGTAIGIRKCAVQRRNQKIIEESGDAFLTAQMNLSILAAAENMARISGYDQGAGAGTVEFLFDQERDMFGFLEMNTRLQVEHPVTDQSLGIDLAKWQVLHFDGRDKEIPFGHALRQRFIAKSHAIEARIYAENPAQNYNPAPGKILELDLPTFNGIRCDFGFNKGDRILPDYDPMIGKVIAKGDTREEALVRMERALSELYIKGVTTNIDMLLNVMRSDAFRSADYSNLILSQHASLARENQGRANPHMVAAFAALITHERRIRELAQELMNARDLDKVLGSEQFVSLPASFQVELSAKDLDINLIFQGLGRTAIYVNSNYLGQAELLTRVAGNDDYFIRYSGRSYHVRFDRRASHMILRTPDEQGKIGYYALKVFATGGTERMDPTGMLRSPFQGTFVKFCAAASSHERLRVGMLVNKGEPMIVLSAMKMETTLVSPVTGRISYLLENGDLGKLQLGKTAQNQVIGRNINEGEILVLVAEESAHAPVGSRANSAAKVDGGTISQNLFYAELVTYVLGQPEKHIVELIQMTRHLFLGYHANSGHVDKICSILQKIPAAVWTEHLSEEIEREISWMILHYAKLTEFFSPAAGESQSLLKELTRFFTAWDSKGYIIPDTLKYALDDLFAKYRVSSWMPTREGDNTRTEVIFVRIIRSYIFCRTNSSIIRILIDILRHRQSATTRTIHSLRKLIMHEEAERDNSLADAATALLEQYKALPWKQELRRMVARPYADDLRNLLRDPLTSFREFDRLALLRMIDDSLRNPVTITTKSVTKEFPAPRFDVIRARLEILLKRHSVIRYVSPIEDVFIFGIASESGEKTFLAMVLVDEIKLQLNDHANITGSLNLERAHVKGAQVMAAYLAVEKRRENRTEVIATLTPGQFDLASDDSRVLNYETVRSLTERVAPFFSAQNDTQQIFTLRYRVDGAKLAEINFRIAVEQNQLIISLLHEGDINFPYGSQSLNPKDQLLFDRGKWPIELWTHHCFDLNSAKEIKISRIDDVGKIGSKIYTGSIAGKPALFYLKDSRIQGGATGNLEGLKYIAACYLAYVKKTPLYVFNDGAGANIREGMVALNRAGEGFMMNALLRGDMPAVDFYRYLDYHPDEELRLLIASVENEFEITRDLYDQRSACIIAVGVGSSTGLDVYGASQAALQIMVDSEQSYRVLTGSNVIKSVTGEDISNYKIGGARVMSVQTGTVDLVAHNNLHLLAIIRRVHILLNARPLAERPAPPVGAKRPDAEQSLSAESISRYVDDGIFLPLKAAYYGASALVGGLAQLGGRPLMLMATRNDFGIRSYAAITKARELMTISRKAGLNQIIVLNEMWHLGLKKEDDLVLRARHDLLRSFQEKSGVRIHIVTDPRAMSQIALHDTADAVIAVTGNDITPGARRYMEKTASLTMATLQEAFAAALAIMQTMDPGKDVKSVQDPVAVPAIPTDSNQPFDIVNQVIVNAFDKGTFIEYYGGMNDPVTGPSLITGIAKLFGMPVGIIADQPAIMGGAPDAPGTDKFRMFTEYLNKSKLPLVMLSNAPGFVPGTKQERLRIQQIGGVSLDANILGKIPVVSVVLNQNFGGRQIHAFSKFLRPGIVYIALARAIMAVMGATASFDLFEGKKYGELRKTNPEAAEALRANYVQTYNEKAAARVDALQSGVLDWVFDDIANLRAELRKGLRLAVERTNQAFATKYQLPIS